MTDYKEILEALRDEDNCNVLDWIDDAADAIKELLSENERLSLCKHNCKLDCLLKKYDEVLTENERLKKQL